MTDETDHLLSSPANAERLRQSVAQAQGTATPTDKTTPPPDRTSDLPDLWDIETCQNWLESHIRESLTDLLKSHDGLTSRFCDACGNAWFFAPDKPVICPHCQKPPHDGADT